MEASTRTQGRGIYVESILSTIRLSPYPRRCKAVTTHEVGLASDLTRYSPMFVVLQAENERASLLRKVGRSHVQRGSELIKHSQGKQHGSPAGASVINISFNSGTCILHASPLRFVEQKDCEHGRIATASLSEEYPGVTLLV